MIGEIIGKIPGEMSNHLWQSTWFAIAAALLTIAFRKNRAQVRYWLWLSASIKFLIPFALLMSFGDRLWYALAARKFAAEIVAPAVSLTMVQITQPFSDTSPYVSSAAHTTNWIPFAILAVWVCGFSCIALMRFRGWLHIRAAVRASTPINISAAVVVSSSPGFLEPGVVGFLRPVLLLPEGILKSLTPPQLEAVLAHELCHIRRRDNLTSTIHMVVEAVFWFHPAVWWIGTRLVQERERACDEAVLSLGSEPRDYADAILSVCKLYMESPLVCVSGISGSDLKKRIVRIMIGRVGDNLTFRRKLLLAVAGVVALTVPVLLGITNTFPLRAQSTVGDTPKFDAVSIKLNKTGKAGMQENLSQPGGYVKATNFTLRYLIEKSYFPFHPFGSPANQLVVSGTSGWMDSEHFDVEARAEGNPTVKQKQLMLKSVLADRFKLTVHHETRQLPIYDLVLAKVGKTGPQLVPHGDDTNCVDAAAIGPPPSAGTGRWLPTCGAFSLVNSGTGFQPLARDITMGWFAENLSGLVGRLVVDRTGLSGTFDVTLAYTPDSGQLGYQLRNDANAPDPSAPPSIFTALQEQLGLKLDSQTGPVDVLVVDHAEEPSPN